MRIYLKEVGSGEQVNLILSHDGAAGSARRVEVGERKQYLACVGCVEGENFEEELDAAIFDALRLAEDFREERLFVSLDSFAREELSSYVMNVLLFALIARREEFGDLDVCVLCEPGTGEAEALFQASFRLRPRVLYNMVESPKKQTIHFSRSKSTTASDRIRAQFERQYLMQKEEGDMRNFRDILRAKIIAAGYKKDPDFYKAAGITKFTFSKIMNYKLDYKPSKSTVAALAFGLRLPIGEAEEFFHAAGYHLTENELGDAIVRFFLEREIYDVQEVNDCLFYYGITPLGERTREEVMIIK